MKVEKCIASRYIRKEENKAIDFIWKVDKPLAKEEKNEFFKILDEKYIEFDEGMLVSA